MTKILDSGNRTEFESGAVRDIQQGKGRFDLMPLDIMADIFAIELADESEESSLDDVLHSISEFRRTGCGRWLCFAIVHYSQAVQVDLPTLMLDVAQHFENGALKYGERNWEKGIPVSRYIDSALRHLMKDCACEVDEDHEAAFVWNLMCCAWTIKNKPELNDYAGTNTPKQIKFSQEPLDFSIERALNPSLRKNKETARKEEEG